MNRSIEVPIVYSRANVSSFFLLILVLLLVADNNYAQVFHFTSNETLKLYTIDLELCEVEEIIDLQFPSDFLEDHRGISAMVHHPDGKVYATNGRHLMTLNLKTGMLQNVFAPNPLGDIYWLGMTVDAQNRILIGYYNLNYYDPVTGKYTYKPGNLNLDNFTIYNDKIIAAYRENFEYVDIHHQPVYRLIDKFSFPGLSEMTAITTYNQFCVGEVIYGFDHNLEHNTRLYRIDPVNHTLDTLCIIDVNFVTAMSSPLLYQNPFVQPDLDLDNSSGHTGNGYFTQWQCDQMTYLADKDIGLKTCRAIDSIRIETGDIVITDNYLSKTGDGFYRWINSENLDTNGIKEWLSTIILQTDSVKKAAIIKTFFYSENEREEAWTIINAFDDPFSKDTVHFNLCNHDRPINLDSVLDIQNQAIVWSPGLSNNDFDPDKNKSGQYQAIRYDDRCPDTVVVNLHLVDPPATWPLSNLPICHADTLQVIPEFPAEYNFSWLDIPGQLSRTFTDPGIYAYQLSNEVCTWKEQLMVTANPDCSCSVFIPNAFTPNGDGSNDYFEMYSDNCIVIKNFQIFDRWGTLVFSSSSSDPKWDGANHQSGTYVYSFVYFDKKQNSNVEKSGSVTLLR